MLRADLRQVGVGIDLRAVAGGQHYAHRRVLGELLQHALALVAAEGKALQHGEGSGLMADADDDKGHRHAR